MSSTSLRESQNGRGQAVASRRGRLCRCRWTGKPFFGLNFASVSYLTVRCPTRRATRRQAGELLRIPATKTRWSEQKRSVFVVEGDARDGDRIAAADEREHRVAVQRELARPHAGDGRQRTLVTGSLLR